MPSFTHDLSRALAVEPLARAFDSRRPAALSALDWWNRSTQKDILALRRSLSRTDDLVDARPVVDFLLDGTTDVVVLGVGGSSLGAQTLSQLGWWGTQGYAAESGRPRLHFPDNLDSATLARMLQRLDFRTTRFHVVSKSGTTAEVLLQLLCIIDALETSGNKLSLHFTGEAEPGSNPVRSILSAIGAPMLEHDPALGGRYTAFSTVGLVPAMLVGLDATAIRAAGREAFEAAMLGKPDAAEGAALSVAARDIGLSQSVLWVYSDRLERLSKWWRQLWAESLGKGGKGTTPVDALGPVDQHSQLQLYLDGPPDKLFTVIDVPAFGGVTASEKWARTHGLSHFAGRDPAIVTAAQVDATVETLRIHDRPVRRLSMSGDLNEARLGALMMHFILETLVAARLWEVDPFGQPAVEEGKRLTRQYLDRQA
jgi:glucose-6-phosphate isomerase